LRDRPGAGRGGPGCGLAARPAGHAQRGPGRWRLEPAPAGTTADALCVAGRAADGTGRLRGDAGQALSAPPREHCGGRGCTARGGGRHMKRFYIPLGVFALLVVLFAVALVRAPEKGVIPSALIGKPAPQFTLPDLRQPGASISIADFKDRWVLVNMWATWCQPCRVEHPVLIDMERSGKVAILGVSYKDEEDKARKWLE